MAMAAEGRGPETGRMRDGAVISGRRLLIGGTLLLMLIGAIGFGWVLAVEPQAADPAFWGTPTPEAREGVLPFR
jgi:hypothetical protein